MATTVNGWPYVEGSDLPVQFPVHSRALADRLEATVRQGGTWQAYTPTTAGATYSTLVARYARIGQTLHVAILAGVTTVSGNMTFSLPAPVSAPSTFALGTCMFYDTSANFTYAGHVYISGAAILRWLSTGGRLDAVSPTAPFTWAAGDTISALMTYETSAA